MNATLAQQVEHHHGKVGVTGSSPVSGLSYGNYAFLLGTGR